MAITTFTANMKPWNHVGNITPNFEHSESERPHFDSKVAPWLPINGGANSIAMGFMSRFDVKTENYYVVSSGKAVACDRQGYLLPAGVQLAWAALAGGSTALTYTAADVTARVIDLGTGTFVTAAKTYTKTALTLQLKEMGYLNVGENLEDFIGLPVGLASYNYIQSAGTDLDNPATYGFHNYKAQDRVAIVCDYVVRLPHVPIGTHTGAVPAFSNAFVIADLNSQTGTGVWGTLATFKTQMDRYDNETNANAVGLAVTYQPGAAHTSRTPVTHTTSGGTAVTTAMLQQKFTVSSLTAVGDWFWDAEVGVLWFFESGANALPTGVTATDLFHFYDYTAVPATVSTYSSVVGNVQPGDMLTYDVNSNLVLQAPYVAADMTAAFVDPLEPTAAEWATALNASADRQNKLLGQVLGVWVHPKDALDKVRTAYRNLGVNDQMPGSATKGFPDTVTYSGASDREVIINLIRR